MQEILLQVLKVAYACVGVIGIVAYWPTLKDLHYHKKPSANSMSYFVWSVTTGVAFLYSIFVLGDPLFRFVSGLHFLACLSVLLLSVKLVKYTNK